MRTFRQSLQGAAFTLSAELLLRRQTTVEEALSHARILADSVDGIQIAENPFDWVQISPVAMAGLLIRNGIDAVPRLSCRDRNRIALHSELLGLRASGVTSVMLTGGSAILQGHETRAKPVFDANCRELLAMAHSLNEEDSSSVQDELLPGTDATVFLPPPGWSAEELLGRASAGARFLQTQICFDTDMLRRYMQRMVETKMTWNCSVIVTLAPLPNADTAVWLSENIRNSRIPAGLIKRLKSADQPEKEGIDICAGLMREIAGIPGVSGINLLSPGSPEAVVAAIESSGLQAAP